MLLLLLLLLLLPQLLLLPLLVVPIIGGRFRRVAGSHTVMCDLIVTRRAEL